MNKDVDKFLAKLKRWPAEAAKLRRILLSTKVEEKFKWNLPCYSYTEGNVVIMQPFKACLGLMFFKGSLLKDPAGLLTSNGPNSRAGKRFEFRSVQEVTKLAPLIRAYVKEAIQIEESGQKVDFKKKPQALPAEFKAALAKNSKLKKAFFELTPGRQRAYILYFAGAKQVATRQARIGKCLPRILNGRGLTD